MLYFSYYLISKICNIADILIKNRPQPFENKINFQGLKTNLQGIFEIR